MDQKILNAIREIVGEEGFSTSPSDLHLYSYDQWPRNMILRLYDEKVGMAPEVIVWPQTVEDVSKIVHLCFLYGIPIIPYGGGSGVCGGVIAPQGGVIIDLKKLNKIIEIDEFSLTALVEGGIIGNHLEKSLNERGFTLGHFPSSIMCSTLGGWVATRSAGQFSSKYGKIEDMVIELEVVLPNGIVTRVDRHYSNPNFCGLFLGSEGTLCVIVKARLQIHPLPQAKRVAAFRFVDVFHGVEAMRSIMQKGLRPAVMRLYDPLDSLISGLSVLKEEEKIKERRILSKIKTLSLKDLLSSLTNPALKYFLMFPEFFQRPLSYLPLSCILIMGFEGDKDRAKKDLEIATELCAGAEAQPLGPKPAEYWYSHRYDVSFKLTKVFAQNAFAETIEVAGLWRDVMNIYKEIKEALIGRVAVMAHFSHAYREGCAIYFTIAGFSDSKHGMLDLYDWAVRTCITKAIKTGATISHHHGIGYMKRPYILEEYRGGEKLYWALKETIDPSGIMNPRKVYPPFMPIAYKQPAKNRETDSEKFNQLVSWQFHLKMPREIEPEVPEDISELLVVTQESGHRFVCQSMDARENGTLKIELSRLDSILEFDPISGTVTVQAGLKVRQLENYLREKGFTLGFVPRSKRSLSIGEYVSMATPYEGSPLYGNIIQNCLGLSAILPDGSNFCVRPAPRRSVGPDLMSYFIGGQGRYGIITAVCLRIFPLPVVREALAYGLDDPVVAMSAVRTLLVREAQPEWVLIVIRAPSDQKNRKRVRVVMQFGGTRESVSGDMAIVRSIIEPLGAIPEPVRTEDRMVDTGTRVPSIESFLPLNKVIELTERIGSLNDLSCPEVHITDIVPHGATFRLLLRKDSHAFPSDISKELSNMKMSISLIDIAQGLKRILDPAGILNPIAVEDEEKR